MTVDNSKKAKTRQSYRWLLSFSNHCRVLLLISVFIGFLNGLAVIVQAYLLSFIIYQVAFYQTSLQQIMHFMWFLLLAVILRAFLSWIREVINFNLAVTVKDKVREKLKQHIIAVGPTRLAAHQSGALSNILIEQVEALHDFFANYLPQMFLVTILPLLILFFVFFKNWLVGLLLLITAPLIPLFMALVGMGAESRSQKQFQQMSKMSGYFLDVLRGLMTLKLFKTSFRYQKKIAEVSDDYRKKTMNVLRIAFISSAILELFSSVAIAMIAVYLGLGLLGIINFGFFNGMITLQSALFILLLAPEFFLPLRQLGTHYHARAQAIGAVAEIQKILAIEITDRIKTGVHYQSKGPPYILFDDVSFSYDGENYILNQFNINVLPKCHTVIIGESGSGKSTILNLINAFIRPTSGIIQINGINLQNIETESWRKHIAWLGQNTRLFYGTIRDNLLIAKPQATKKELFNAIEIAYLDEVIRQLPLGLDTRIGEQNKGLSYGQIQRVALCRAYLKNAPILLLDEATANLDLNSEKIILAALNNMKNVKTIISVTHRNETMSIADSVIRLEKSDSKVCSSVLQE